MFTIKNFVVFFSVCYLSNIEITAISYIFDNAFTQQRYVNNETLHSQYTFSNLPISIGELTKYEKYKTKKKRNVHEYVKISCVWICVDIH